MEQAVLPPRLQEHLELVELLPDRADRIQYLISQADRFREVPAEVATRPFPESHRVPQCESEAYVWATPRPGGPEGTLDFHFAVENPQGIAAKALAAILADSLPGEPLSTITAIPGDVVYSLFGRELSMGKNLGLLGMLQMCQAFARRQQAAVAG
ncbi:MAG TPA: SufE family protein [Thermoanaerobaculia bacterium]|nr:SufE family protein [Thermoanaerobaculia bacterium]